MVEARFFVAFTIMPVGYVGYVGCVRFSGDMV
jgi:hypothetical protein